MKQIFTLFLIFLTAATTGHALSFTVDGINYIDRLDYQGMNNQGIGRDNAVAVAPSPNASGDLDFSQGVDYEGVHYDVICINRNAFKDNKNVTGIKICAPLSTIGEYAFSGTNVGGTLVFEEGINLLLDRYAFENTPVESVFFNCNQNQALGQWAFANCPNLSHVEFNGSNLSMSDHLFENDANITEFSYPPNSKSASTVALQGTGITELTIPATVTQIYSITGLPLEKLTIEGDDTPLLISGPITTTAENPLEITITRQDPPTFSNYGSYDPFNKVTKDIDYYFPEEVEIELQGAAAANSAAYKDAEGWEDVEYPITTGIADVETDSQHAQRYFTLDGVEVKAGSLSKGLYIICSGNKAKKVITKKVIIR